MATVTPKLLGKGVVDTYIGTHGQTVHNADVVYAECGKCGYVNVIYRSSFLKRRASIPTSQGKLIVQAFSCTRCKAVNSTKGLSVKQLEQYTHIDTPTVQTPTNGTEPTPSADLVTSLLEHLTKQLEQQGKIIEVLQEIKQELDRLNGNTIDVETAVEKLTKAFS